MSIRGILLALLIGTSGVAMGQVIRPPVGAPDFGSGNAGMVSGIRQVVLGDLPQVTAAELAAHPATPRPRNGVNDADWNSRGGNSGKRRGSVGSTFSGPPAGPQPQSSAVMTPSGFVSFGGATEPGTLRPSDMAIAAGSYLVPSGTSGYVIQVTNADIRVHDKATGAILAGYPKSLNAFLGLPANAFTFDPRAFYDASFDRFVVVLDRADFPNSRGFVYIAASNTGVPTGSWSIYAVQLGSTGQCPDFPTLGFDRVGIYIGANIFPCNTNGFFGSLTTNNFLMLRKSDVYAGVGAHFWIQFGFNVGGTILDTLQPASVFSPPDNPRAEFIVNSFNINFGGGQCFSGCNGVVVWSVSNQFGFVNGGPAPVFSGLVKGTSHNYFESLGAHEPGCTFCIDSGDTRISGSVSYIAGSLFWSLTTSTLAGSPEQTSVIWSEIRDIALNDNGDGHCTGAFLNACPTLTAATNAQEDCFGCGGFRTGGSAFYGALQPDLEKNVVMVYSWSSSTEFPGLAYAARRVNFALNQMHDFGFFLVSGQAFYDGGRWGDYNATSVDLFDPNPENVAMWFSGMYANAAGKWSTQIGATSFRQNSQIP